MFSIIHICENLEYFNDEMIEIHKHIQQFYPENLDKLEMLMREQEVIINDVLQNITDKQIEEKRTQDMVDILNQITLLVN